MQGFCICTCVTKMWYARRMSDSKRKGYVNVSCVALRCLINPFVPWLLLQARSTIVRVDEHASCWILMENLGRGKMPSILTDFSSHSRSNGQRC